jgi:outer membrane protein OmpA-like peptidoglycan-associated protein
MPSRLALPEVHRVLSIAFVLAGALFLNILSVTPADAQFKKLKDAAANALEDEAANQVDRLLKEAIRCAIDDPACRDEAERDGKPVIYTDRNGELITNEDGEPITDREEAAKTAGVDLEAEEEKAPKPGEGAWANYDFVPGDRVLFTEDYADDNVGDFPRRLEFMRGNWEVVEWEGQQLLRNTGPRAAAFKVILPEELPEMFTIEFDAYFTHGNQQMMVLTGPVKGEGMGSGYDGNYFQVDGRGTGVEDRDNAGVKATNAAREINDALTPIRIMADGRYVKMYVGERRVANIPNANLARTSEVIFLNNYIADEERPILLGPIRIAAGGKDLYDVLEAEGRVSTQGIYFDTNSDRIRPESTPTLKEIGKMLQDHPDLRISIEGHTDSDGDDAHNQDLSERRAASVKAFLAEAYDIDASRLETAGLGESVPVAPNDTPEGKQQNRRVDLVKL